MDQNVEIKKEEFYDDDEAIEYEEYYIEEIVETEEAPEYVEEEYIIESEEIDESIESSVQYQCDKCFKLFDKHYNLEQHMLIHADGTEFVSKEEIVMDENNDDEYENIADEDTIEQEHDITAEAFEGEEDDDEEISYEEIEYNGELIFLLCFILLIFLYTFIVFVYILKTFYFHLI